MCAANALGAPGAYPRRAPKPERPQRFGAVFRIRRDDGALWLVRRPDRGLLGAMAALPTTQWGEKKLSRAQALKQAPVHAGWKRLGQVRHVFTHFGLTLDVYEAHAAPGQDGWWGDADALPTVFRKVAEL
jgi:A/G-specific adenine glycosylase